MGDDWSSVKGTKVTYCPSPFVLTSGWWLYSCGAWGRVSGLEAVLMAVCLVENERLVKIDAEDSR